MKIATERDLTSAVSLAIDGDLFVLSASGTVAVFSAGDAKSFAITDLDPPPKRPKSSWTYNGLENLYILEPVKKRIVVLDKTGKLVRQYTDTTWVNPESMVINEEKRLYTYWIKIRYLNLDYNPVYLAPACSSVSGVVISRRVTTLPSSDLRKYV